MPAKITMTISDPAGDTLEREVEISDAAWTMLVEYHSGWARPQIPNPAYDAEDAESEEPETIDDPDDKLHVIAQTQAHFERAFRAAATRTGKTSFDSTIESQVEAEKGKMKIKDRKPVG